MKRWFLSSRQNAATLHHDHHHHHRQQQQQQSFVALRCWPLSFMVVCRSAACVRCPSTSSDGQPASRADRQGSGSGSAREPGPDPGQTAGHVSAALTPAHWPPVTAAIDPLTSLNDDDDDDEKLSRDNTRLQRRQAVQCISVWCIRMEGSAQNTALEA